MMRAVLEAFHDGSRKVWLADSFQGYPVPDAQHYPADTSDPHRSYLELVVSLETVKKAFERSKRRNAFSWSSAQMCELERQRSKRTDLRL